MSWTTIELQRALMSVGYDVGPDGADGAFGPRTRSALRAFQTDVGIQPDGIFGVVSEGKLKDLRAKVQLSGRQCRRLRVTSYYVVDENDYMLASPDDAVPIYQALPSGKRLLRMVSPYFFAQAALEGTARCLDGTLLNVQGGTIPVSSAEYEPVLAAARKLRFSHLEFAGIRLSTNQDAVVAAVTFEGVPPDKVGVGFGVEQGGIPKTPFRTCAADESLFKPGAGLYIPELDGIVLPDGCHHDGIITVNDVGSAIKGLHIDLFVGTSRMAKLVRFPEFPRLCHVVTDTLIPLSYTHGLVPS